MCLWGIENYGKDSDKLPRSSLCKTFLECRFLELFFFRISMDESTNAIYYVYGLFKYQLIFYEKLSLN